MKKHLVIPRIVPPSGLACVVGGPFLIGSLDSRRANVRGFECSVECKMVFLAFVWGDRVRTVLFPV